MPRDGSHLAVIVFPLHGPPPRNGDDLRNFANRHQIVGDIRHDVADADDRHAVTHGKLFLAEWWEEVVVIDQVLGVIDVWPVAPGNAQRLRPLCARRDHDRARLEILEFAEADGPRISHGDTAEVNDPGIGQDLPKLLPQALFHLVLRQVDAVLRQATGLDVAVEDHDGMPFPGNFACGIQGCRPRTYHNDQLSHMISLRHHHLSAPAYRSPGPWQYDVLFWQGACQTRPKRGGSLGAKIFIEFKRLEWKGYTSFGLGTGAEGRLGHRCPSLHAARFLTPWIIRRRYIGHRCPRLMRMPGSPEGREASQQTRVRKRHWPFLLGRLQPFRFPAF